MYRLSRFFVSDIVAGENILRNGDFPVFKENQSEEHGIIVAANGSCKTTLLSFLFSVFTPDRRRFVQYLQSNGDKTLEQYLVPGRPAVVMLNLSMNLDPTLFDAQPREQLVLGQILHRHKITPDKIDRIYFFANSEDFFEIFRNKWEDLSQTNTPYTSVKEFIRDKVHQTTHQGEWEEKLESLGLDPWLVNRQVDFSRSEGGIKDSFKFKSEEEFLSFFLGCVSDLDSAMGLHKNTSQTIAKMKNRPEKKKQLNAVLSLKKNLGEFHDLGREWRTVHGDMEACRLQLGEAVYLLTRAKKEADMALAESETTLKTNQERQISVRFARETARANQVMIEETGHARQAKHLEGSMERAAKELEQLQDERVALKASHLMATQRNFRAEVESREKILAGRDSSMAPARRQVELKALQYHTRLGSQRMAAESAILSMEKEILVATRKQQDLKEKLLALGREMLTLNGNLSRLDTQIKAAVTARNNLGIGPGDDPGEVLVSLERQAQACEETLRVTTTRIKKVEAQQGEIDARLQDLYRSRIQGEETLKKARELMGEEKGQRGILLADPNLITIAGSASFEPTRADLATRLGESLARVRNRIHRFQVDLLETENELKRLESMDCLMVDAQVARLIAHYTTQGLSPAELKPFLDYLSGMDKTPEEIARVVERDPGRFTGIMAATDEVIEKVQTMSVPDWLHKPVIISTPRDLDKGKGIEFPVITPSDPIVYSKHYLEDQKKILARKQEKLNKEVSQGESKIISLEASERRLHGYREKYPDLADVDALSRRVDAAGEALISMESDILVVEKERDKNRTGKKDLEGIFQEETRKLARLEQVVGQVKNWLEQYGQIKAWEEVLSRGEIQKVELDHAAAQLREGEKEIEKHLSQLQTAMAGKRAEIKNLDERADDIPVSQELQLTGDEKDQALSMDLSSLRKQYEQAQNNAIRMATDLGIDGLRNELNQARQRLQKSRNDLDRFSKKQSFDQAIAEQWAGKSSRERDERTANISVILEDLKEKRAEDKGKLEGTKRDLARCRKEIKMLSSQGIHGDLALEDLENTDLDALILHYGSVAKKQDEAFNELKKHGAHHGALLEKNRQWDQELKMALAMLVGQEPCWDSLSPRGDWLELVRVENRVAHVIKFREQMEEILKSRKKLEAFMETSRKKMGRAFDRLQGELRDETLKKQLPAIVDELSRHDAETLGAQSGELMEKCTCIATNIESDLSRSAKFVESLVDQLFQHARVAYQKLQTASKQTMPDNVFVYGGKSILKAGTRLDFTKHGVIYRKTMDNWLDELIQENRIPEVNAKAGDTLGTEILYRLLKVSSAKQEFGIRLLKCDDTGRNYEPVGKDLGSGGEALTTAVLLYSLLTSMRQKRRSKRDDRIPAFLIADNPLGVCNRSDFLDTQLKVARAMGIQCIYFTGINDRESLGLFQHRVAIRHSGNHLQVDGKPYNCLEVIEQNVENRE